MYCSHDDIKATIAPRTLTQLSNDDPSATEPDWVNVDKAIQFAVDNVDGFLRGRYSLPLTNFDTLVTDWTVSIARYKLYLRRPEGKDIPPAVKVAYDDAIASLKLVQANKMDLGFSAGATGGTGAVDASGNPITAVPEILPSERDQIRVRSATRLFNADRLKQY